jgi:hypothetical protein
MQMSPGNFRYNLYAWSLLILFLFPSLVLSDSGYSNMDFSVRLPPAFVRFTEISALGGETVANRFSSAVNPASLGWMSLPSKYGIALTPYYSFLNFEEGMQLNLFGESMTWDTRSWGVIQPTLSQVRTNNTTAQDGLTFDYQVDVGQVQWGKRYGNWALGADLNYARANVKRKGPLLIEVPGFSQMMPVDVDTETSADSYRLRIGGLYQPSENWLLGMILEYGWQPYRLKTTTQMSLPFLPSPIQQTTESNGKQQQYILRPGLSYEYAKGSTLFLDYQLGHFNSDRDNLINHRFNAGIEHRFLEWLFVRFSPSVDLQGNVGVSFGLSAFLSTWCSIEAAYQYNMYPEIEKEFGRAQTIQSVLAFWF